MKSIEIGEFKKIFDINRNNRFSRIKENCENASLLMHGLFESFPTKIDEKTVIYFTNANPSKSYAIGITSDEKANKIISSIYDEIDKIHGTTGIGYFLYASGEYTCDEEVIKLEAERDLLEYIESFDIVCDCRWCC